MFRAATAAIAHRIARLPNAPMMAVASGGPATQAKDMIARVLITSDGAAPEYLSCANSSEAPTPAGPPSVTRPITATGKDVASAKSAASASVSTAHASSGRR